MLLSLGCTFITTIAIILFLRPIALRLHLADAPGGRKQHEGVVPLIGGISMGIGFMMGAMTLPYSLGHYRSLFVAAILLLFTGVLDDFKELSPKVRLLSQLIASLLISVFGYATLESLGNLFFIGNIHLGWLALPITWFGAMSLINSVNMMDGIDGLVGGLCLFSFGALAFLCLNKGDMLNFSLLMILIAALLGFLVFNFRFHKPALIFMGDAGSLFLGLMLAWFAISLSQGKNAVAHPVTMLWLMALPLMDLLAVFIHRLAKRRSPLEAGSEHFHYLLVAQGFSRVNVVFLMWLLSLIFIGIGLAGEWWHWNQGGLFVLFLVIFAGYFYLTRLLAQKAAVISS